MHVAAPPDLAPAKPAEKPAAKPTVRLKPTAKSAVKPVVKSPAAAKSAVRVLGGTPTAKAPPEPPAAPAGPRGEPGAGAWEAFAAAAATAAMRAARGAWPDVLDRLAADPGVRAGLADLAAAAARLAEAPAAPPPTPAEPPAPEPEAERRAEATPPPVAEAVAPPAPAPPGPDPAPPAAEVESAVSVAAGPPVSVEEIEARLKLGAAAPPAPAPAGPAAESPADGTPAGLVETEDVRALAALPARCRAKAAALRWAAKRAAVGAEGDTLRREKEDLRAEADAAGGSPWPLFDPPPPGDHAPPATWDLAAATFDVLADAADNLHATHARLQDAFARDVTARGAGGTEPGRPEADALRHALDLAAEAQSMALLAVRDLSELADRDQKAVYKAIRDLSGEETGLGYYIRHYLKEGSSADPAGHADLAARVASAAAARNKEKRGREAFKKFAHAAAAFADHRAAADRNPELREDRKHAERTAYHAGRAAKFAADLLKAGVPASDVRFRDALPADAAGRAALAAAADPGRETDALDRVFGYLPAPAGDAGSSGGPPTPAAHEHAATVDEALDKAQSEWPDAFAVAFNNRSTPHGYPFKDADQFYRGLKFLATTFRDAKARRRPCPDLVSACKEESGLDYSPNQSPSTMGEFPEYYRTLYAGAEVPLKGHLGRGNNKDPRLSFRLAFYYDKEADKVVLGFLGQHQRTRAT